MDKQKWKTCKWIIRQLNFFCKIAGFFIKKENAKGIGGKALIKLRGKKNEILPFAKKGIEVKWLKRRNSYPLSKHNMQRS